MALWKASDRRKGIRQLLLEDHRHRFEMALLYTLFAGGALTVLGAAEVVVSTFQTLVATETAYQIGMWTAASGLLLTALSLGMGYAPNRLRTLQDKDMGDRYAKMKRWTRIKVLSVLLQLLVAVSAVVLVMALLALFNRFDPGQTELITRFSVIQIPVIVTLVTALAQTATFYLTLRTPSERPSTGLEGVFLSLSLAVTALLAIGSGLLTTWPLPVGQAHEFGLVDAPFFLLAAAGTSVIALFIARGLPTIPALVTEEHTYYRGRSYMSRRKSVVMPISIAFAVLFVVILLVVFFQLSFLDQGKALPTNAILLGFVGFIVLALLVSLGASIALSQTGDDHALFQRKRTGEERTEIAILGFSAAIATLLLAAAATLFVRGSLPGFDIGQARWLDLLTFGILAAIGPYGFYYRHKQRRIRSLEARFPDFLRDLAASRKAGLTLTQSVKIAARGEYGELTPDIQKMADQLAWNVPFVDALQQFGERVKTPLVQRATSLIIEAQRSGGHVTDVLEAAARDARELKNLEDERRLTMTLYTAIVYIAFFVFLGVASVLYGTFLPEVVGASEAARRMGGGGIGGMSFGTIALGDYRTFYFIASLSQAVGNGAIAGMMESGDAKSGLIHAFTLVTITYAVFALLLG